MKKDDVVREVARRSGSSQPVVRAVLTALSGTILDGIIKEGTVRIGGLGLFKRQLRKGRTYYGRALKGRATPAPVTYEDCYVVKFKPAAVLKETLYGVEP